MNTNTFGPVPASTTSGPRPTPATVSDQSPLRPWHSRAAGDVATWADTYAPRSKSAASIWEVHGARLEPWISATSPAGVTEARRVASAVLELLAWALPGRNDLAFCMTEETLHAFSLANPTGLGDGALQNVRGRVRRVFRARERLARRQQDVGEVGSLDPAAAARSETDNDDLGVVATPPASGRGRRRSDRLYSQAQWDDLITAATGHPELLDVLTAPWARPEPDVWAQLKQLAAGVGVDLRQERVQLTLSVQALSESTESLGSVLVALGLGYAAASAVSRALPAVSADRSAAALRGTPAAPAGHCTSGEDEHGVRRSEVSLGAGEQASPRIGGVPSVSTPAQGLDPDPQPTSTRAPARRRKPSARQARLALAAVQQETAQRANSLPTSMSTYIRQEYRPKPPVDAEWGHIKEAVEAALAASAVRGADSMRKHVTHLAYFFSWAREVGLPLGPETVTRAHVARYDNEVLAHGGRSTRQNRRSRLAQMADQIHPEQAPIAGPPMAHRAAAAPYSAAEMATIRRVARHQPTPLLTRQVCLLVGLGAGAGVDSTDLKRLRGADVTDHGPKTGIEVRVTNLRRSHSGTTNRHQRTVWVLREYEDLVRTGITGVPADQLLLGRDADRANVAASVFARASFGSDVPELSQSKLRSTWLSVHLSRPTPLNVLLDAAGLTTARTLVDLLAHLPPTGQGLVLR